MRNQKSIKIGFISLGIIVLLSLLVIIYKDDKLRINSDFEISPGYEDYVDVVDRISWSIKETSEAGDVLFARLYTYKTGIYTITINCEATAEGSSFAIVTNDYVTRDNEIKHSVIDNIPLEVGRKVYNIEYTIPSFCRDVALVVHYGGKGSVSVERAYQQSIKLYYYDALYTMLCIAMIIMSVYLLRKKNELNYRSFIIVFIGLIASVPALGKAIYFGADIQFHLMRIQGLAQALSSGQIPVRMQPIWQKNIGYPVSVFYPDLILYPAAILVALGVSEYFVLRSIFIFNNILTMYFAYKAYASITKSEYKGLVAASFYTLSIFRFLIMFHSVGIGNILALTFAPIVLWGVYEIIWGNPKKWYILALGMTGTMASHLLTTILVVIMCAICALLGIKSLLDKKRCCALIKAILLFTGLNLYFIVPFLETYSKEINIVHQGSRINETVVYLSQMFQWFNYGGSYNIGGAQTRGEIPISIGLFIGIAILLYIVIRFKNGKGSFEADACLLVGCIALWISSEFFPWNYIIRVPVFGSFLYHAQFAWRYNAIAITVLSVVAAVAIIDQPWIGKKKALAIGIATCVLGIIPTIDSYIQTQEAFFEDKYQYHYDFSDETENRDYLNVSLTKDEMDDFTGQVIAENASISNMVRNGVNISFDYKKANSGKDAFLTLPIIYSPYYNVVVDGVKYEKTIDTKKGEFVDLTISTAFSDSGHIDVSFLEPPLWRISELVSLLSLAVLMVVLWHNANK